LVAKQEGERMRVGKILLCLKATAGPSFCLLTVGQCTTMILSYDVSYLNNPRVTENEVNEVLASTLSVELSLEPSKAGNPRYMLVGFTLRGSTRNVKANF